MFLKVGNSGVFLEENRGFLAKNMVFQRKTGFLPDNVAKLIMKFLVVSVKYAHRVQGAPLILNTVDSV